MKEYTFTGPKGCEPTTVSARSEAEARHKAMVKRWGPFRPNDPVMSKFAKGYQGLGLDLTSVSEA